MAATTVHQIIATINPSLYYKTADDLSEAKKEIQTFKELIAKDGFQKAAEKAKPKPLSEHKLVYDSSSETLEPVYFFIIDLMNDFRLGPEKLVDNFVSSPGSGHFAELGQRATIMQQQASRILGDVNNVTRSVLNLVYDLKEFKIRLQHYDDANSKDKNVKEAASLALKQIWMDKVDISKGNSSIKAMAFGGQVGYQTLIDAFLITEDDKQADSIDLNDRVKRVVKQRINEFNLWRKESEKELRKRYEIERKYLKSQVNMIKLYSRWAKPYLRAAQQLEMINNPRDPGLVKVFNTVLLELTVLGKTKLDVKSSILEDKLPKEVNKIGKRDYYSCTIISFNFRGIPQRITPQQPHYVFGGRVEITFTSYTLNADELEQLNRELDNLDVSDALKFIEGATTGSLDELQKDIDSFLDEENDVEKKKQAETQKDLSNPILALLGFYDKKTPKEKPKESSKPENYVESQLLRPLADEASKKTTFDLFDIYKKAHGMPSYT